MEGWIGLCVRVWMDGWVGVRIDGWMDGQYGKRVDGSINNRMIAVLADGMEEWVDRLVDECIE